MFDKHLTLKYEPFMNSLPRSLVFMLTTADLAHTLDMTKARVQKAASETRGASAANLPPMARGGLPKPMWQPSTNNANAQANRRGYFRSENTVQPTEPPHCPRVGGLQECL